MSTSSAAKIVIELDSEEAKRQLEELQAHLSGGSPGGRIPGRAPPSRVPIAPPMPGGGGMMGVTPQTAAVAAAIAAAAVVLKDVLRDVTGPLKTTLGDLQNFIRQGADKVTDGYTGRAGMKARAFEEAYERTREFGRDTFGKASDAQLDAYFQMQMKMEMLKQQGDRNAENRRMQWSPGIPSLFR